MLKQGIYCLEIAFQVLPLCFTLVCLSSEGQVRSREAQNNVTQDRIQPQKDLSMNRHQKV